MERDWERLGTALKTAREARGLGQAAVGGMIGVKRGAMRNIENGAMTRVTATVRAYARVVGWDDASIEAVLTGGEPTQLPPRAAEEQGAEPAQGIAAAIAEELPLRIQAALAEGPLIDTAVIALPGDDDGPEGQMVVIVKGRNNATPEQLKRALLKWEQTEARLRGTEGDAPVGKG